MVHVVDLPFFCTYPKFYEWVDVEIMLLLRNNKVMPMLIFEHDKIWIFQILGWVNQVTNKTLL
jgi:hypothetical protein